MRKLIVLLLLLPFNTFAQNDLLAEIDTVKTNIEVESVFKSLKIINLESTKLAAKDDFYLIIAHRFDYLKNGFADFFGLDNASTQIKVLYGINDWLNVHASRSGFQKTYELATKYRLVSQKKNGSPIAVVGFNSITANAELNDKLLPKLKFVNRLSYTTQLLISRKFSNKLSLEVAPTFFHENYVLYDEQNNNQFALGMGGRYKISKHVAFTMDYVTHLNRATVSTFKNPLAVGVDIETGGHVFQLHFTNAQAMHEAGFIGNTSGSWGKGEISFGFNLVRVF